MKYAVLCAIVFAGLLAGSRMLNSMASAAPRPQEGNGQVRGDEITPEQQRAVENGLAWLAAHQLRSGGFSADGSGGYTNSPGGTGHVGISALAGLAFMAGGNLPGRGKYGQNVEDCLNFVLGCCTEKGFITSPASGEMYSHGFATLFLGEVYGMSGNDDVREKLLRAVRLIENTQSEQNGSVGGWRYQPVKSDADISITICQIMALRAAIDAGIKVKGEVMDKAMQYVKSCQDPTDGGFSYTSIQGSPGGSGFARTGAGVASMYYAGIKDDNERERVQKGVDYLAKFIPVANGAMMQTEGHYFYGNYYATQAMFMAGGDYWARWYPAIRASLLARITNDHWSGEAGEAYCTAMALIILQMPNRYLPVFHGKGKDE